VELSVAVGFSHVFIWSSPCLNRAPWSDLLRCSWFSSITSGICLNISLILKYFFPSLYQFIVDNRLRILHSVLGDIHSWYRKIKKIKFLTVIRKFLLVEHKHSSLLIGMSLTNVNLIHCYKLTIITNYLQTRCLYIILPFRLFFNGIFKIGQCPAFSVVRTKCCCVLKNTVRKM
jgi:hypothetical protein